MSEDPTENMDVVSYDAEHNEWIAVPPGAPIADQSWLTSITQGEPGEPAKRDLVLVFKFDTLLDRLRAIDKVKMWGTRKTIDWMVRMLDLQGIELVGIQRQHTPNAQPQMQERHS
jgi:hypothetical protein